MYSYSISFSFLLQQVTLNLYLVIFFENHYLKRPNNIKMLQFCKNYEKRYIYLLCPFACTNFSFLIFSTGILHTHSLQGSFLIFWIEELLLFFGWLPTDCCKQMLALFICRPSSRLGHSDPINYSHYQNAEEIRQQILQHDHYAEEFRRMQAHHQRQVSDSSSTGNHPASNVYYQQNNVERSRHLSNASSEASNMPVPVNSANISHPMTLQDNSTSLQLSGANNGHFTKSSYTALPVSRNHNDATMNSYHYPDTAPYGYRNQNYIPPPGSARV